MKRITGKKRTTLLKREIKGYLRFLRHAHLLPFRIPPEAVLDRRFVSKEASLKGRRMSPYEKK